MEYFLRSMRLPGDIDSTQYPYTIPSVRQINKLSLEQPVTFLVGENGSGKSTIIEALARSSGFSAEGGTKNYTYATHDSTSDLADHMILSRGTRREKYGYFLRAESFYTTANYAESGTFGPAGPMPLYFDGKRIHEQSHGEAFMAIASTFRTGLFIFDEPESALSPQRQLKLMSVIHDLVKKGSQFIIATHSPILLAYPGARIYELSNNGVDEVQYDSAGHVAFMRDFIVHPDRYTQQLLDNS